MERDLASVAEARALARSAARAQLELAEFSQERIDTIVDAMAAAVRPQAETLARLAVEETGYGRVTDKIEKTLFSANRVHEFIRPMKTVGVVRRLDDRKVIEIAEPFGVVAAIVPSTNPTSTAVYKILISIKARCAIVVSPHPAAVRCITRTAEIMYDAARQAGAPEGCVSWMTTVSLDGTAELMKHRDVALILATGGLGLVRAAYSSGKPAYGVGPGNAPAYIERTADLRKAVGDIITGKTFDNGVLCSSENAVVVDESVAGEVEREFVGQGGHFLSTQEADAVAGVLVTPQRLPNPAIVGRPATVIAEKAGFTVPASTRVLLARLDGVGRDYPLSIEKLCPVLAFYVVADWREACERCKEILRYGGTGHTMAIHSRDDAIILEFGLHKPAFRICVNTPTTHGSIGLTTGLDPAMTLGCGGYGGNITSDNISPRHLLNIKRLAYEIRPARADARPEASPAAARPSLPRGPVVPVARGIAASSLASRIDEFLASRSLTGSGARARPDAGVQPPSPVSGEAATGSGPPQAPTDFVCEDDVRVALAEGRTILIGERTIVTPSARDLGEARRVFVGYRLSPGP
jgi:acetaldehyde dehydrogenase (acetylating)